MAGETKNLTVLKLIRPAQPTRYDVVIMNLPDLQREAAYPVFTFAFAAVIGFLFSLCGKFIAFQILALRLVDKRHAPQQMLPQVQAEPSFQNGSCCWF